MLKDMSDMIAEDRAITPDDLAELFSGVASGDMFNDNTLKLLYIMARSNTSDMTGARIPVYDFFMFLSEDIMQNEAFSSFFDENVAEQFESAKVTMEEGLAQLVGEDHSRMVITLNYEVESEAIYAFYDSFNSMLESTLSHEYYLVGMTAMSYEVSQSFEEEYRIISIVTAVAVLLVVWFTFKKFFISLLLIGVIECAVFSMMSVMVLIDLPMYFIPLILVQCILMGSMIDYGILFTTYYMEVRKEFGVEEALPEVMRRATHSILTSSLLIVLVTLICGRFMSGAVASILTTLGIGSLCAILLILFVLPSLLVIFDKIAEGYACNRFSTQMLYATDKNGLQTEWHIRVVFGCIWATTFEVSKPTLEIWTLFKFQIDPNFLVFPKKLTLWLVILAIRTFVFAFVETALGDKFISPVSFKRWWSV
jgi:hypothetical protein